jgi:transposase
MQLTTVGLDIAKSVFQVHGVDRHGKVVLRKSRHAPAMSRTLDPAQRVRPV